LGTQIKYTFNKIARVIQSNVDGSEV